MKKVLLSLLVFIFLFSFPISSSAKNTNTTDNDSIESIYEQAYNNAITTIAFAVNSEIDAYSFILANKNAFPLSNKTIIPNYLSAPTLSTAEKSIIDCFVFKLNNLMAQDAIYLDALYHIRFVLNPEPEPKPRRPVANIMSEARNHAKQLRTVYDNAVFASKNLTAGKFFAERVQSGGIWDYKSYLGTHTYYYMEDLRTTMSGEEIGNFHYGYVGSAVWPETVLKSAAGMYQIYSGTSSIKYWDSFFDDPADQYDIQRGINKYKEEH